MENKTQSNQTKSNQKLIDVLTILKNYFYKNKVRLIFKKLKQEYYNKVIAVNKIKNFFILSKQNKFINKRIAVFIEMYKKIINYLNKKKIFNKIKNRYQENKKIKEKKYRKTVFENSRNRISIEKKRLNKIIQADIREAKQIEKYHKSINFTKKIYKENKELQVKAEELLKQIKEIENKKKSEKESKKNTTSIPSPKDKKEYIKERKTKNLIIKKIKRKNMKMKSVFMKPFKKIKSMKLKKKI